METVVVNAKGKSCGRLSTHIANILNGKHSVTYAPNIVPAVQVRVENVSEMTISKKKKKQKVYIRYTGYPGGLRKRTLEKELEVKGHEGVLRRSIAGMLPKNKLRTEKLKRILFSS